jgi:NOL1/NOP2/fmu family ribosome biogenesis protein
VLDLCGAPGGKSTHLSELIGRGSLLVTNDAIRSRASILAENLTKWGSSNTIVTQSDPSAFGKIGGYFDIILIDAPCSGEGMFRTNIAVSEWSAENTAHCAERQKRILMDIWPGLKEGGLLIYSTCTFNPGENEENIKWLTSRHEAECQKLNISSFKGITEIDYEGIYGYGFYPGKVKGEGFFISVLRKTARQDERQVRAQRMPELIPGKQDIEVASGWTDFFKAKILRWGDELFAVPCGIDEYTYLYHNLKVIKPGTRIAIVKNDDYLPSHELALSDKLNPEAFPRVEIDLAEAVSYLRRDNIPKKEMSMDWNIVTYKGISIGFVKNIGTRVNNYFPVEWRVRLDSSALKEASSLNWE